MENAQIAGIFDEIADLLELRQENRFRIRSYRSAAQTVRGLPQRLADRVGRDDGLTQLPYIGQSTAEKIVEIARTGSCRRVEQLRQEVPSRLRAIMRLPPVGPRKAMQLHKRLHIESLSELKDACERHRVQKLEGMGRKTATSVYRQLGLQTVPPELREDRGEVEAAKNGRLPKLIEPDDIRGDLHCHTKASDGANTIEEMARAARERGYNYLAITDHSKAVRAVRGLTDSRLRQHTCQNTCQTRRANERLKNVTVLAGVEVDIFESGKLDLKEEALAELDWVTASVHSHFNLDKKKMTNCLLAAIESGVLHGLGHPPGRVIGRRNPIPLEMDRIFTACKKHHVLLEINSQPGRLDLPDAFCRAAREAGVQVVIDADAHAQSGFDFVRFGVTTARRCWLTMNDVLNTLSTTNLLKKIKKT